MSRCQCNGAFSGKGTRGKEEHGTTRFPEARLDSPKEATRNPSERHFKTEKAKESGVDSGCILHFTSDSK